MASLEAIRDGIKTTIDAAITSLHGYDTVPDVVNLPAYVVAPVEANFDIAMGRGTDTWQFDIYVLAPYADAGLGQDALDGFVTGAGSNSIRQAIFNTKALGLADVDAHVSRMSDYGAEFAVASIEHVGAVLRLVVHTKGTA